MHRTFTAFFFFIFSHLHAQWFDSFDRDSLHPEWKGDVANFAVNADRRLQLRAPAAGQSLIHRKIVMQDTMQWAFYFKMDFSPSNSNRLRIALMLNRFDSLPLATGYTFEVGENGSEDRWRLKAIRANHAVTLAQGEMGKLALQPAMGRFRLTRFPDSTWIIESDYLGNISYTIEQIIKDTIYYVFREVGFGLECTYTSTRTDKFFFDDIVIGQIKTDYVPPFVVNVDVLSEDQLRLQFNEKVEVTSALNEKNYFVQGIGHPDTAEFQGDDSVGIKLRFDNTFISGRRYVLEYENIADVHGNTCGRSVFGFSFEKIRFPEYQELLITEIMADPSPAVALPEAEYLELYNNSAEAIQLLGCKLTDASSQVSLPGFVIQPGEYVIVCSPADSVKFNPFGRVLPVPKLFALNNSEDVISIFNADGEIVFKVQYSDRWYGSAAKREGGYSLEMVNTGALCTGSQNWTASEHPAGGTPGQVNSVAKNMPDTSSLQLVELAVLSEWEIQLTYNKTLDPNTGLHLKNFSIMPRRSIATLEHSEAAPEKLIFLLDEPLMPGTQYTFYVHFIADCTGRAGHPGAIDFSLPADPKPGELLINEVLFNPVPYGVDYVELINAGTQDISTNNLYLRNILDDHRWIPIRQTKLLKPGGIACFTANKQSIISQYPFGNADNILESMIPAMADDECTVVLSLFKNNRFIVLDSVRLLDDWHHPFLATREGVALERVRWKGSSTEAKNWQSASAQFGYGTPGAKNSQYLDTVGSGKTPYRLSNRLISPNVDGVNDECIVHFNLEKGGYKVLAEAYDLSGNKVKTISTSVIAANDIIKWDGSDDDLRRVKSGNYILLMQLIHPEGDKMQFKERITVVY